MQPQKLAGADFIENTNSNREVTLAILALYRAVEAPLYQRIIDSYNETKRQAIARVMNENKTWQVPTLIRVRTTMHSDDARFRNDPNLTYTDKATRAESGSNFE